MAKESITKKASNTIVWIILLLLILGLAGFGVTNFGGSVGSIGAVGDQEIDIREYQRTLQQELRALEAETGKPASLSEAMASAGIDRRVQQRLILAAALDDEAARLGISAGDTAVRDEILSSPAFQGLDGKFDRETYRLTLEQAGMSEAEYENLLRREMARTILQNAVIGAVSAPESLREAYLGFAGERRNFTWVRLGLNDLPQPLPAPDEAQLKEYYQSHTADFTLPEMKAFTYVWVTPEMLAERIEPDEAELKQLYESRLAEYVIPERRTVERLVFPTGEEAETAMKRLESGAVGFADLVAERGLSPADITLSEVTREQLDAAGDAVFALEEPGLAGLHATPLGPAIFRVSEIFPAQETTFDEARPALETEHALQQARRRIAAFESEIEDLIAGGATLEEVAEETDLELGRIEWAEGMGDGIADYEAFRQAAKAAKAGDFPELHRLEDGGIFALRFDTMVAPRVEEFEKVRDRVIAAWETRESEKALRALAEELAPQFAEGADLAARGHTMTVEQDITRGDYIGGTPLEFLPSVFEMQKGEVKILEGFGAAFLVRLDDILPPDEERPELARIRAALDSRLRQAIAQDLFAHYVGEIQRRAGIRLNPAAINAVHAQFP